MTPVDTQGWEVFPPEPATEAWARDVRPLASALSQDPELQADWQRHGGSWFAGVGLLPNDVSGAVGGAGALRGRAAERAQHIWGADRMLLDRGQVSVCHPGYPGRDPWESASAHRFRATRDAAHLDGLIPEGAGRRRFLRERHAFILGVSVTEGGMSTAPTVAYEGSHRRLGEMLAGQLGDRAPDDWAAIDLTDAYAEARRACLEACPRRLLHGPPGTAFLLHRHLLHGIAPWPKDTNGPADGRIVVWFRPEPPWPARQWLSGG